MGTMYFNFRIIDTECGDQVINRSLKTPYNALTPLQMAEYMEMDAQLAYMDRMKRKARIEAERRRKMERNPFWKLACICGVVCYER